MFLPQYIVIKNYDYGLLRRVRVYLSKSFDIFPTTE